MAFKDNLDRTPSGSAEFFFSSDPRYNPISGQWETIMPIGSAGGAGGGGGSPVGSSPTPSTPPPPTGTVSGTVSGSGSAAGAGAASGSSGTGFFAQHPFLADILSGLGIQVGTQTALEKLFPLKTPSAGDRSSVQDYPLAMATLIGILANQGRTDPQLFNRQLVGIGRDTEAQQMNTRGLLTQMGLQNSGVGAALQTAVGQAGADRLAGARAQEAALAEERKRSDLGLLLDLIINPSLTEQATRAGVSQSIAQANAARQAGYAQAGASVLDAILNRNRGTGNG